MLPLSDMKKEEVRKIATNLKLKFLESDEDKRENLMQKKRLRYFIEERAPKKFLKEGHLIEYKNDILLGDHAGIHTNAIGTNNLKTKSGTTLDKGFTVLGHNFSSGATFVCQSEYIQTQMIQVYHFMPSEGMDFSRPMKIYFKTSEVGEKKEGVFVLLNNGYGYIYLDSPIEEMFPEGEHIVFYNRNEGLSRVIGSAAIRDCGYISFGEYKHFPKKKEEEMSDEEREPVDIYKFKF